MERRWPKTDVECYNQPGKLGNDLKLSRMTTIAIVPEYAGAGGTLWRAVAGEKESAGKTAGEALDKLNRQLEDDETTTLVIVQRRRPDQFFPSRQRLRTEELISRWRADRHQDATF